MSKYDFNKVALGKRAVKTWALIITVKAKQMQILETNTRWYIKEIIQSWDNVITSHMFLRGGNAIQRSIHNPANI